MNFLIIISIVLLILILNLYNCVITFNIKGFIINVYNYILKKIKQVIYLLLYYLLEILLLILIIYLITVYYDHVCFALKEYLFRIIDFFYYIYLGYNADAIYVFLVTLKDFIFIAFFLFCFKKVFSLVKEGLINLIKSTKKSIIETKIYIKQEKIDLKIKSFFIKNKNLILLIILILILIIFFFISILLIIFFFII